MKLGKKELALKELLKKNDKVVIAGGCRTGKTTLSYLADDRPIVHTDDFINHNWKDVPQLIIEKVEGLSKYVVEGTQAARALRKGLKADVIVYLACPVVPLTEKQLQFNKGVDTVFNDFLSGNSVPVVYL